MCSHRLNRLGLTDRPTERVSSTELCLCVAVRLEESDNLVAPLPSHQTGLPLRPTGLALLAAIKASHFSGVCSRAFLLLLLFFSFLGDGALLLLLPHLLSFE